jgi:tetratricopeptide (TPR) repeat protein
LDLTTLTYIVILLFGFLGVDAVVHHPDVILEAQASGTFEKTTISVDLVDDVLRQEVERISATPTIMTKPVIRVGRLEGLAMSVSEALKMQALAYALQAQVGYRPDEIKLSLYAEGGTAKVLVSGTGHKRMASFQQLLTLEPGETVIALVQRASVIGMAHIDPYITALSEVQSHADDKDFSDAETVIRFALAGLPPTPVNFDRSLFENLNGIIALFRGDAKTADQWFERAGRSSPDNVVAQLNSAFADMQLDLDEVAVNRVEALLLDHLPTDRILLATAYMTLAAAQLGTHDAAAADRTIAKAIEADPEGSSNYDLWADIKLEMGQELQADALRRKALENSDSFENYSEIAALYFRLAWRDHQPVMRSPFSNPTLGGVHAPARRSQSDTPVVRPLALQ